MPADDPDDAPTKALLPAGKSTRFVLEDEEKDARTVRLATDRDEGQPQGEAAVEMPAPDHVVTRRIASPRRLALPETEGPSAKTDEVELPVGWMTVVDGPGRGRFVPVFIGMNSLGRDEGNRLNLSFGDEEISRKEHCFIIYDDEQGTFWIQHGGKNNLVRLNDVPVMAPTELNSGDFIRLGQTKMRFVALCDGKFNWSM